MQDTSFWLNRRQIEEAERDFYTKVHGAGGSGENQRQPGVKYFFSNLFCKLANTYPVILCYVLWILLIV